VLATNFVSSASRVEEKVRCSVPRGSVQPVRLIEEADTSAVVRIRHSTSRAGGRMRHAPADPHYRCRQPILNRKEERPRPHLKKEICQYY
jgi:hypothetical protein